MSKIEKLIERLKSKPKDFTWEEMLKVLKYHGFQELSNGKTGGSRRKFVNENKQIISLHEPHPQKILKAYQLDSIIDFLNL
ncbi:type II toxin-antitoxin system HicA family toxin [Flavobacterium columnare]|uniref:Type II toxin-antitoxin system HicA family toxin n=1 Tax=Flavobacterium columnare TaxID=996 RepID=A0AA94JPX2_9FLAO|nr:type II toxin-antitoxin system HicA family toxin [Flavobacterium columnare]MCH4829160.1 type II toxin-antitoxin system HicA family toxin [Flavobacterium columnare]MCH4833937.1 type II toxin-antitoxin system HicA family toxin [Flavobacterium columnare]